jgi:hypothetical protein
LCGNVVLNNKDKLPINDLPLSIKHVLDNPCCLLLPGLDKVKGTYLSAKSGHVSCLKEALDNGYTWNASTIKEAAYAGNLNIIAYAHENGCDWDEKCIAYAAFNSNLECINLKCIKYMHENGCPWDSSCIAAAAAIESMSIITYARERMSLGLIMYKSSCFKWTF